MPSASSGSFTAADGVPIAFDVVGSGPDVVLHHGFAADSALNWVQPGVVDALVAAGRRVITFDARGHGRSGKPHDPGAYEGMVMVDDVRGLLDHLGVEAVDVVGYSMGGLVTAALMVSEPRVRSAVLGGVGRRLVLAASGAGGGDGARGAAEKTEKSRPANSDDGGGAAHAGGVELAFGAIADALEADDPTTIADEQGRNFRAFADITGADRRALAALQRSRRAPLVDLSAVAIPVLVLAGDRDELVGDPAELADAIPGAELVVVSGDHLQAVFDPAFTKAIVEFLERVSPRAAG